MVSLFKKRDNKANTSQSQANESLKNGLTGCSCNCPVCSGKIKRLLDQNTHLNAYIIELVQQVETSQRKYDDIKISLDQTKQMFQDFVEQQNTQRTTA